MTFPVLRGAALAAAATLARACRAPIPEVLSSPGDGAPGSDNLR